MDFGLTHEQELIAEYREFLAIPNVTSDKENIRRNAGFIAAMLRRRGVETQVLEGRSPAVNPAWAPRTSRPRRPTSSPRNKSTRSR